MCGNLSESEDGGDVVEASSKDDFEREYAAYNQIIHDMRLYLKNKKTDTDCEQYLCLPRKYVRFNVLVRTRYVNLHSYVYEGTKFIPGHLKTRKCGNMDAYYYFKI